MASKRIYIVFEIESVDLERNQIIDDIQTCIIDEFNDAYSNIKTNTGWQKTKYSLKMDITTIQEQIHTITKQTKSEQQEPL